MIDDWKSEVRDRVALKAKIAQTYPLIKQFPPEPPATEGSLREAESHLGFRLVEPFRSFLLVANGWRHFVFESDLFGTDDLLPGSNRMRVASEILFAYTEFSDGKLKNDDFLIIGAANTELDLILLGKPSAPCPGQVIRISGSDPENFPDFSSFFRASFRSDELLLEG